MSFRSRFFNLADVILRVPPLFVIDEILKFGIGLEDLTQHDLSLIPDTFDMSEENGLNLTNVTIATTGPTQNSLFYRYLFITLGRLLLSGLGCVTALCLFILNTKHLMVVYIYIISNAVVFVSYWSNLNTIKLVMTNTIESTIQTTLTNSTKINNNLTTTIIETTTNFFDIIFNLNLNNLFERIITITNDNGNMKIFEFIQNYILQIFLSYIFINIHLGPRYNFIQKLLPITFLLPTTLLIFLPLPKSVLINLPTFSILLPLALSTFILWSSVMTSFNTLYEGYVNTKHFISHFGMSALVESEWNRLNIPDVLRLFWLIRVVENASIFLINNKNIWLLEDGDNFLSPYYYLMKYLLITGCDTLTAVLGITSIVSLICFYIGKLFQWILLTDDENDKNFGTISAIVFYILALQTGLTSLEPEIRFIRLCRNFCLLFTAILHFTHNVLNPLLMSLSASHNPSLRRHLHALFVCLILVLLPILFMYYLWSREEPSTWLFAVTAFSIEVIVKVFVSLSIYSLFLLDAKREQFWEKLDDYIYYIRAFGNTIEFCFGIFLFFNGAWILLFESGSAIRAVMMCIHAYFNIWCDARAGWSVFIKRRTAVNKIESLPEANDEQLRLLDDVCAICYQEMRSAKITKCRHYFHGVCLRKWLYVQDRCPLCHEILHAIDYDGKNSMLLNVERRQQDQLEQLGQLGQLEQQAQQVEGVINRFNDR